MQIQNGLILTRNMIPACQIRTLIETEGLKADIVLSDIDAYAAMSQKTCEFLVCDVDDTNLQGIFVADWFRYQSRGAPWYAICKHGNSQKMRLAREKGANGYFFLNSSGLALDAHSGMTHMLLTYCKNKVQTAYRPILQLHQVQANL